MIVDHTHPAYKKRWKLSEQNKYNGAFYYSKEIVQNIIPNVETDRNWVTINVEGEGADHAIVFIHNNLQPERYEWLSKYRDLILVCGIPETCAKVAHLGEAIHLPLSVDLDYLERFKTKKTKGVAFAGRRPKRKGVAFHAGVDFLEGMPRPVFLQELARYRQVFAVGRVAIEAKALGAEILPYDPRFPDPSRWQVLDNRDAAAILAEKIAKIDKTTSKVKK